MSVVRWVANLLQIKADKALSRLDGPDAVLDRPYEEQLAALQELKRPLADVMAEQRGLEQRMATLRRAADDAEGAARAALQAGSEDRARAALEQKQAALRQLEPLEESAAALAAQAAKLRDYEARLKQRIEQFRTQQRMLKTGTAAAQAQVKAGAQLAGAGRGAAGEALRSAEERLADVQAKAEAKDMLLQSGVLADPLDKRSAVDSELSRLRSSNAVDAELESLKAKLPGDDAKPG